MQLLMQVGEASFLLLGTFSYWKLTPPGCSCLLQTGKILEVIFFYTLPCNKQSLVEVIYSGKMALRRIRKAPLIPCLPLPSDHSPKELTHESSDFAESHDISKSVKMGFLLRASWLRFRISFRAQASYHLKRMVMTFFMTGLAQRLAACIPCATGWWIGFINIK